MKNWEAMLISLYFIVSDYAKEYIDVPLERQSRNKRLKFTDAEAITCYLYGIIELKNADIKGIHKFIKNHLNSWFPNLPEYEAFTVRLSNISEGFIGLIRFLQEQQQVSEDVRTLSGKVCAAVDSMPIMLAKGPRAGSAKVAKEYADKGYCASKKTYYYGVKLHAVNLLVYKTLPQPYLMFISAASANDCAFFHEQMLDYLPNNVVLFSDRAYQSAPLSEQLRNQLNINLMHGHKRKKKQEFLASDVNYLNTAVSSVRQPLESYFNWIIQKTGIQDASKVRSSKALLTHIFARLAVVMLFLTFFN